MFALVLGCGAVACAASDEPGGRLRSQGQGGASAGGQAQTGSGGFAAGGAPTTGSGGSTGTGTSGGSTSGGNGAGGFDTGAGGSGGNAAGGFKAGGGTTGGGTSGSGGAGGSLAGAGGSGGGDSGGKAAGGFKAGGPFAGGGNAGGTTSGPTGGTTGGPTGGTGGAAPVGEPDCNAPMPSGGETKMMNNTGGEGNLAWEIWSNTGEGQLTIYEVPAFIAAWNNSGGYLGRLGYEWGRFGQTPVPHDQRGTITAQFVSRKTGSAGGYSYIGMYGWTTNPCVEWYVVDDSYNNMPINPGNTTKEGEVDIDGGTYIVYSRPTTGSGGTRCSGATNWIQYYSVRKTARACGVISLSQHFRAWEDMGLDMSGELLEAKILVEVGGGVGNVELPIANVMVQ